jgi:molybdopterin molybdotransferase
MDLNEARQLACGSLAPLGIELVRIEDALGRVLGERFVADRNLPGESRSRLDGFALRSADTLGASSGAPVLLRIIPGGIAAGHAAAVAIRPGEAIRILTGAPLPRSGDTVAPQEEVAVEGESLCLERAYAPGSGVALPGDEIREGEFLLAQGNVLTPARLALMAALGCCRVTVYRQPRVALLATGDEVRPLGNTEDGPFIYCNNMHLLAWLTQLQGGIPARLGVVRDDPRTIADRLQHVTTDLVITTGGMGKGDRDFILEAWRLLGVRVLLEGINLTPGKNTALGMRGGQVFLGVSGNPWASQIVFTELVVPMLRQWQGLKGLQNPLIGARLKRSLKHKPGFYKAVRGSLNLEIAPPWFTPAEPKRPSVFSWVRDCFAYVILEPHVVEIAAGSELKVRLSDFPLLASPLFKGTGSGMAS